MIGQREREMPHFRPAIVGVLSSLLLTGVVGCDRLDMIKQPKYARPYMESTFFPDG